MSVFLYISLLDVGYTPSACRVSYRLEKMGSGLAQGFNAIYLTGLYPALLAQDRVHWLSIRSAKKPIDFLYDIEGAEDADPLVTFCRLNKFLQHR